MDNPRPWNGKTPLFIAGVYTDASGVAENLRDWESWTRPGNPVKVLTAVQQPPRQFEFYEFLIDALPDDFDHCEINTELEVTVNDELKRLTRHVWFEDEPATRESLEKEIGFKLDFKLEYEKDEQ